VLNDHRCYIPYLGLGIAVIFGVKFFIDKFFPNAYTSNNGKKTLAVIILLFLGGNAFGVYQRNKVWHNDLTLWSDVTEKSPENGRGWMNYGVALMQVAEFEKAETALLRAASFNPTYSYIYINLGILKGAAGDPKEAEIYYKKAIDCRNFEHVAWYYYGHFLLSAERYSEAETSLLKALEYVPDYYSARVDLLQIYLKLEEWQRLREAVTTFSLSYPNDPMTIIYNQLLNSKQPLQK
jgi:tetratricopeptide (TPR) repeat protein